MEDKPSAVVPGIAVAAQPKWAVPPRERGDDFQIEPLTRAEIFVHATGGLLNGISTSIMLIILICHVNALLAAWPCTVAMLGLGLYVADFVSGFLHWVFDTWFSERNKSVRRMVLLVREHHIYPGRIFDYGLWREAGILSWFALAVSCPFLIVALRPSILPAAERYPPVIAGISASLCIVFMLEFHKVGHRMRRGRVTRLLQRSHLLLSPEHHLRHHAREHDRNYCLINGWADVTLGRLGVFRGFEHIVSAISTAAPREDDREWRRRYGRFVKA